MERSDSIFTGSVPELYQTHLVPLIFERFAVDLAGRLAARPVSRVLEVACGTGVVTRELSLRLPGNVPIVATDRNAAMLDKARAVATSRPVEWRPADAMDLPFADASFDAVVCQFGVMFFPDKARAYAEARRVLGPGGAFLFNVWDRIEENEFADCVTTALETLFPDDPPRFLARTPHGYHDVATIRRDLTQGGFAREARVETLAARSRATSPRTPAIAYCLGTPLRDELAARDPAQIGRAVDVATEAIARRFGAGPVDGQIQGHIMFVEA